MHKLSAVDFSLTSAESVSFRRQQPEHPPTQNVNSAHVSPTSAGQFGGNNAKYAKSCEFCAYCDEGVL
jgi:hypothetical protein